MIENGAEINQIARPKREGNIERRINNYYRIRGYNELISL